MTIGAPFVETKTIADITARLEASKRFDRVTVLKRFASIADPSRVLIVIVVDEGPVRLQLGKTPGAPFRVVRRGFVRNLLFVPILDAEDGYGLTYGDARGDRRRSPRPPGDCRFRCRGAA